MKVMQLNSDIIESLSYILNTLRVICLSLIFSNISCGIYSISKESKYTAKFLSISNETQCVPLLFLSSRFMPYPPSFIFGKLFLEKTSLNLNL